VCITTLRDVTGNPAAPLFFAAATMVLTVVALGAFRWIERRRVTTRGLERGGLVSSNESAASSG